jgi:hypothetical protein
MRSASTPPHATLHRHSEPSLPAFGGRGAVRNPSYLLRVWLRTQSVNSDCSALQRNDGGRPEAFRPVQLPPRLSHRASRPLEKRTLSSSSSLHKPDILILRLHRTGPAFTRMRYMSSREIRRCARILVLDRPAEVVSCASFKGARLPSRSFFRPNSLQLSHLQSLSRSFAPTKVSSSAFSAASPLFAKNTRVGYPPQRWCRCCESRII